MPNAYVLAFVNLTLSCASSPSPIIILIYPIKSGSKPIFELPRLRSKSKKTSKNPVKIFFISSLRIHYFYIVSFIETHKFIILCPSPINSKKASKSIKPCINKVLILNIRLASVCIIINFNHLTLAPKGIKASLAILKCCRPKGIPTIVMHRSIPKTADSIARGIPVNIIV